MAKIIYRTSSSMRFEHSNGKTYYGDLRLCGRAMNIRAAGESDKLLTLPYKQLLGELEVTWSDVEDLPYECAQHIADVAEIAITGVLVSQKLKEMRELEGKPIDITTQVEQEEVKV